MRKPALPERAAARFRRPLGCLVALLVLTACGGAGGAKGAGGGATALPTLRPYEPGATTSAGSASDLLPLQQFMLVGRDYNAVQRAVTILAQQCMVKQGFDITLPPPVPATGQQVDISVRRYGVQSLADAQRYGYDPSPKDQPAPDPAGAAFEARTTPAESKALIGADLAGVNAHYRNGCVGEADRKLMAGSSAIVVDGIQASPLVRQVNLDPRSVESRAEQAALKVFQRCMAAAGFPDVTDPRDTPAQFERPGPVTAAARAAAVTQFKCQQSSGVTAAMRAAEVAFQLKAIDANPEAFAQIKAEIAAVVRRATTIVSGGRG